MIKRSFMGNKTEGNLFFGNKNILNNILADFQRDFSSSSKLDSKFP